MKNGQVLDNLNEIDEAFHICENAFFYCQTEYKRLSYFKSCGEYIPSNNVSLGHKSKYVLKDNSMSLEPKEALTKFISLRKVFTALFEKPGVFKATQVHVDKILKSETYVNFIQGNLWKKKSSSYAINNKIVYPVFLYFDDFQDGNALGSKSNKNKLGAICVSIPCLPSYLFPTLRNIFLFSLFYTQNRKDFGNKLTFNKLIEELKYLQEQGIEITVDKKIIKICFKLGLILGDNLGIHSILGLRETFSTKYCCRFCKIEKTDLKIRTFNNSNWIRTEQSYNEDVNLHDTSTGVKEPCVWHELPDFHLTSNFVVDIMHDVFEGICPYDVTSLLQTLIMDYKMFSLDTLNSRMRCFNYGKFENSNIPPAINAKHLKTKIKMSANEMLCFTKHLGLIIGDLIPQDLEIWNIWILLREIIDIICAPLLQFSEKVRLKVLIEEYLTLIVNYFKFLKPKHHFLLHYPTVIENSGPLVHMWSMHFEQKHRESKLTKTYLLNFW